MRSQAFTLNVQQPPAITSAASTTFTVGTPGTFTVTTTGFPTPTVSQTGTLPTGVTFTPATRVLGGTATQTGAFPLVFTATNGVPPDATQNFTLNVVCPAITVTPLVDARRALPDGLRRRGLQADRQHRIDLHLGRDRAAGGLDDRSQHRRRLRHADQHVLNGAVAVTVTDNFGCPGTLNTTITVRPTTDNENYTGGVGNTQFVVGAPLPSTPHVLRNDNVKTGDNGPGAAVGDVPGDVAEGGTIVEGATDGTFIYTPTLRLRGAVRQLHLHADRRQRRHQHRHGDDQPEQHGLVCEQRRRRRRRAVAQPVQHA